MARQRFIHPTLWTDPVLGRLAPVELLFYIGCFSNADDDGRLYGDPAYLKSVIFPYHAMGLRKIVAMRDKITQNVRRLHFYQIDGVEYLAFDEYREWQKPKYPSPSKLPAPPLDSGNVGETFPQDFPTGWEGLGGVGSGGVGVDNVVDIHPGTSLAPVPTSQNLLAEFIDGMRLGGVELPNRVKGQTAQAVKALLDEGLSPEAVRAGLSRMAERRIVQPSLLPNFVAEAGLPRPEVGRYGRGMTTQQILDQTRSA